MNRHRLIGKISLAAIAGAMLLHATHATHAAPSSQSDKSPPVLLAEMRSAAERGEYDPAAEMFFVALAYNFYDALRTSSPNARASFATLAATAVSNLPAESLAEFAKAGQKLSRNPPRIVELLSRSGRPAYKPEYITGATTSPSGFNPESEWLKIVNQLSKDPVVPR